MMYRYVTGVYVNNEYESDYDSDDENSNVEDENDDGSASSKLVTSVVPPEPAKLAKVSEPKHSLDRQQEELDEAALAAKRRRMEGVVCYLSSSISFTSYLGDKAARSQPYGKRTPEEDDLRDFVKKIMKIHGLSQAMLAKV
jgi:hypothetical protein